MKWTVSVVADRSVSKVLAAIANEHELMQWSAWATPTLPVGLRQVVELVMGPRVRKLHVEDLRLLKQHVERTSSAA